MVIFVDERFYTKEYDHGMTPAKAGRVIDRAGVFDLDHTFYYDFEADIFSDALNRMQDQLSRKDKYIMAISQELDLFHKLYAWSRPMFIAKDVDLDSLLKDVEEGKMIDCDVGTITMHELWNKNQELENKNRFLQKNLDIMIQIFDESGLDYCIMSEDEFEDWELGDPVRYGDCDE